MYQEERFIGILQHLQQKGRISTEEICELFEVSRDTARRDIVKLEEQGRILRTRGGAILPTLMKDVVDYHTRLHLESTGKHAIGKCAASLVQEGDYLFMEASTTVLQAAECLRTSQHVVVTNSMDIAGTLSAKNGFTVHLLGGVVHPKHRFIAGSRTIEMLRDYHADKLLLGTAALSAEGLSNPYEDEGHVHREMVERADQVIVLADHSKFGQRTFYRVAGLEQIDILITNKHPEERFAELLDKHGIHLIVATDKGEKHI
jgi:DeoR family transcriptional regulator, carbon catabolite repression regulator